MSGDRLNVLCSSWNYPPRRGGIEEMVRQLFGHLSQIDDVVLMTSHVDSEEAEGKNLLRSPRQGLFGYLSWLLWRLPKEARKRPGTVLLSSGALVGSWVQLLNLRLRRPHVVIVYGTDITYSNWLYQRWVKGLLRQVSLVVAISRSTLEEVLRRDLADPGGVVVIHPGVDPEMPTLPATPPLATDLPVLLFVGRVIPRKGLRPFIEHCFPLILDRIPVELWVVGGDATASLAHRAGGLAEIHEWLAGRPEAKRIRFLGEVPNETLRGALERAKLLVVPAVPVAGDVEGFGLVFLEAALFGVPAVSTEIGGIPDAVIDGETGLLTQPGDWRAFAEAVIRLLKDPDLYSSLSAQARRRAAEDFSWPRLAAQYHEVLARVAPGNPERDGNGV